MLKKNLKITMNNLFLSLGHNSSAISKDDSNIIGYEQERIDGIKSSSQFPIDAINEINKNNNYQKFDNIYISHWFDSFNINNVLSNKYADKKYLFDKNIITHTKDFTHHDAHCYSSYSFYKYWSRKENKICDDKLHFIVADGFGNNQECLSVYILEDSQPKLIHRTYGYNKSLGLMYQYATSFCGMKENQDEYKFLGYESHIDFIPRNIINKIILKSDNISYALFNNHLFFSDNANIDNSGFINIDDLLKTKKDWYIIFNEILDLFGIINDFNKRVIIGFFIQNVIEKFFEKVIDYFNIKNVCLSGGCFYNVKLNNSILKNIKGYLSVVPICGDQGASIGFQEKYEDSQFNWENINWGKRNFYGLEKKNNNSSIIVNFDEDIIVDKITKTILNREIANFVQGNMEYGPRALGNTSSLLLPYSSICNINNNANNRNEVMPNAPIILDENKDFFFNENDYSRIIGSDKFMIITYDYKESFNKENDYSGVSHKYPNINKYSGRPQFISKERNPIVYQVLKNIEKELGIKALVNTSFNFHGVPIVFNTQQIMNSFNMQLNNSKELKLFVKL
jgi:carbamoyltransferase